jgi:hypothetical protein
MEKTVLGALFVAFVYVLLSVVESRVVKHDDTPFKTHLKSSILVFISALVAGYGMNAFFSSGVTEAQHVAAFTGAPGF